MATVKEIEGFPKYLVSNDGHVYSTHKGGRELKQYKSIWGYNRVTLYDDDGKPHAMQVHRIVAGAFLPNPDNFPQVNHKDEDKLNNHVENLEWCSCSYNINYGNRNAVVSKKLRECKLKTTARKVLQIDPKSGKTVRVWPSTRDPEYEFGIAHQHIIRCCKGLQKTCAGYLWQYAT